MMPKNFIMNNDLVSSKMNSLEFRFEEKYWESFQNSGIEHKQVSTHTPIKISPKIIIIPAAIISLGLISYFAITKLNSKNNPESESINNTTVVIDTQTKESPVIPSQITDQSPKVESPPTQVTNSINKPITNTVAITPTINNSNTTTNSETLSSVSKVIPNKPETISVSTNTPIVTENNNIKPKETTDETRKKKKRKRDKKATTTILIPDPEEDNIVVPEN